MEYALSSDTSRYWTTFLLASFWGTRRMTLGAHRLGRADGLDFLHPGLVLHRQVLALWEITCFIWAPQVLPVCEICVSRREKPLAREQGQAAGSPPVPPRALESLTDCCSFPDMIRVRYPSHNLFGAMLLTQTPVSG